MHYIVIKYQFGDQATIFDGLEFEPIKVVRIRVFIPQDPADELWEVRK